MKIYITYVLANVRVRAIWVTRMWEVGGTHSNFYSKFSDHRLECLYRTLSKDKNFRTFTYRDGFYALRIVRTSKGGRREHSE